MENPKSSLPYNKIKNIRRAFVEKNIFLIGVMIVFITLKKFINWMPHLMNYSKNYLNNPWC